MQLMRFLIRFKCELILGALIAGGALGVGLYYAQKIGEPDGAGGDDGETKINPNPIMLIKQDYGAENFNNLLKDSIGIYDPVVYDENLVNIFKNCGVVLEDQFKQIPSAYLDGISKMVAPIEMLSLFAGVASASLANKILKVTEKKYPEIHYSGGLNTSSKISDFFVCLGENMTENVRDKVEKNIIEKVQNPDLCQDIAEDLKQKMKDKCPSPDLYDTIYEKKLGEQLEKYKEMLALLEDQCENVQTNMFNNSETGEKGLLSSMPDSAMPKGQKISIQKISETLLDTPQIFTEMESSQYFLRYGSKFDELTSALVDGALLKAPPSGEDQVEGVFAEGSKYVAGYLDASPLPEYFLKKDGSEKISNISLPAVQNSVFSSTPIGISIEKNAMPLSDAVQLIVDNNSQNSKAKNILNLSRHQRIFYSLIQNYFGHNSKSFYGQSLMSPVPYGILQNLPSSALEYEDKMYSMVFEQFCERYARVVGFAWQGDQTDALQAYSSALREGVGEIVDYANGKQQMFDYYDIADFDNPNDETTISTKQYSFLNGVLYAYTRLYIMEYFCRAMPYYEVFNYDKDYLNFFEVSNEYIMAMIKKDLDDQYEEYVQIFQDSFNFLKNKIGYQIGANKTGIEYYIESNFNDVYEKLEKTFKNNVAEEQKKSQNLIESGRFIYSKVKSFEVHSYAGMKTLCEPDMLGGLGIYIDSIAKQPYSLFGEDLERWSKFKNGMFFIQNSIVFTDLDLYVDYEASSLKFRRNFLKGALNSKRFQELSDEITNSNAQNLQLKKLFKNIRYESRLCYGIACAGYELEAISPNDQTLDYSVQVFAQDLFKQYINNHIEGIAGFKNTDFFNSSELTEISESCTFGSYMICVDGPKPFFRKKGVGSVEKVETSQGTKIIIEEDSLYDVEGTFSVVIPMFNEKQDVDMDMTWDEFSSMWYGKPFDAEESSNTFQNLNDSLINSDKYKTLRTACFPIKNMIHFNSFSGLQYYTSNNPSISGVFQQTKQILKQNVKTVLNAKKIDYTGE